MCSDCEKLRDELRDARKVARDYYEELKRTSNALARSCDLVDRLNGELSDKMKSDLRKLD
jgi:hypothetical protein